MKEKVPTIQVLAWLNQASEKLEEAEQALNRVADLIWNETTSALNDDECMKLSVITPDDLRLKDEA